MSIKNLSSEIVIGGAKNPVVAYPSHILFCINTPWYGYDGPLFTAWAQDADINGYLLFSFAYGTYAILADAGGGQSGEVKVDPGYNLNDMGRTNQWTWVWIHRDSLSMRGFRIHDSADFTVGGSFALPQASLIYLAIGYGLPAAAKLAHLHFFSSLTSAQYDAIRAGTLDPTSLAGHTDGFSFATGYGSAKGTMTAAPASGTPTFDADNPLVATSGGGGGGVTPVAGVRSYRSSMGW